MLLHIDASKHAWFGDGRYYDLITLLDDATSENYYAQLVAEEGTRTLMPAVQQVIEQQGIFCALYSHRASHFFGAPKAGGKVDENQVTQLGWALQELGIKMIPAYSPQARGRMEGSYRTWQGRLPQELRLRKITTVEEANRFLRQEYITEFNRHFAVAAVGKGSAFVRTRRKDLAWVFSIQHERRVNPDNTIALDNRILQIEKSRWRNTLAGCTVRVYELLDGAVVVRFGTHEVARWTPDSLPAPQPKVRSGARPLGQQRRAGPAAARYLDRPLSRFPLRGQAGGTAATLRYGSGKAPAQSKTLTSVLGRKGRTWRLKNLLRIRVALRWGNTSQANAATRAR